MTRAEPRAIASAEALRHEFDASFARAPVAPDGTHEDVLLLGIRGEPYALRLGEVARVTLRRPVVRLPSPLPSLLGLATVDGQLVAVHDLGAVCGLGPGRPDWAWMLLSQGSEPIAFAVERLDGRVRVASETLGRARQAPPATGSPAVLWHDGTPRVLLSLVDLIKIMNLSGVPGGSPKER